MAGPRELMTSMTRGAVGAMAMTGVRTFAGAMGLVDETPPEAVLHEKLGGLMARIPRERRHGVVEGFHWATGATAGGLFALLPEPVRRPGWAGIAYGLVVLSGFELAVAPLLGLDRARGGRAAERLVFVVDHLLYGLILSPPAHRTA
jgi:hypothetical protein